MTINAPKLDIYIGNNIEVLRSMPAESVDVVVTSPPYWALRDYKSPPQVYGGDKNCSHEWSTDCHCVKCGAWEGQLGLEPTPTEFIDHLVSIFDEVWRVLKPTGACWVNLGDTYMTVSGSNFDDRKASTHQRDSSESGMANNVRKGLDRDRFKSKSLAQIPSRFAIAMTDHGWILRNEIIWQKPNCMPSPVKDRFTVDFEKFFFFTKKEKYYFKRMLEPVKEESIARAHRAKHNTLDAKKRIMGTNAIEMAHNDPNWMRFANPEGRNMRTVWSIPIKGSTENHVAMYPVELIERPIQATCPLAES